MNANQIPYDQLDWLQIAIYFVALPIVAFLGASLGLIGRMRRGGLLWATNVGLLGGAVALLIFAIGIWTLESESSQTDYFQFFTVQYRWLMLLLTLAGTSGCALAAALTWRVMKVPNAEKSMAFSLRQLLLVQSFSMISIGVWIGLRLFMLEATGDTQLAQREMRMHGWDLDNRGTRIVLDSSAMSPGDVEQAMSPERLRRIAKLPALEYVSFFFDGAQKIDLTPLMENKSIRTMVITCQEPTNDLLDQLAKAQLRHLALLDDLDDLDFTRLARASSLENLSLRGTLTRKSIESLHDAKSLKGLGIYNAKMLGDQTPIKSWPQSMETLEARNSNLTPADFAILANHPNLKNLNLFDIIMNEQELSFLPTLQPLTKAQLAIDANSPTWFESLAPLKDTPLHLDIYSQNFSKADAQQLRKFSKLNLLDLSYADHGDEIVVELCGIGSLSKLSLTNPAMTEDAALRLADLPLLREFQFPAHLAGKEFETKFDAKRVSLQLSRVELSPIVRVPKALPPGLQGKQTAPKEDRSSPGPSP